jgi:hypothetical protein
MEYFQNKNPKLGGYVWKCLAIEDVGIFYGHWVYFTGNWNIWNWNCNNVV